MTKETIDPKQNLADSPKSSSESEANYLESTLFKTPPHSPSSQTKSFADNPFSQRMIKASQKEDIAICKDKLPEKPTIPLKRLLDTSESENKELKEKINHFLEWQKSKANQSESLKIALALHLLDDRNFEVTEFRDLLRSIAAGRPTTQSDPAGIIEPILDKIFNDQQASKLLKHIQSKSYQLGDENIKHSEEKLSANIWPYGFGDDDYCSKSNESKLSFAKITLDRYELIEGFKIEKDGKRIGVDLENQESVILKSDNLVIWFKRFGYYGQVSQKAMANLELSSIIVDNQEMQKTELVPSAIIVHRGKSTIAGHYVTYLLTRKEGKNNWFCFDDNDISEVSPERIAANGLPIEASNNCYFVKYSDKSKLDLIIPNVEEILAFSNDCLNHCWYNSAMVFLQSFREFRDLALKLSSEYSENFAGKAIRKEGSTLHDESAAFIDDKATSPIIPAQKRLATSPECGLAISPECLVGVPDEIFNLDDLLRSPQKTPSCSSAMLSKPSSRLL